MSKSVELFKNTIIILIGKISTQFLTFFLLPLYTFFLSTNDYGLFDLITTYIILLSPLLSLQLESSVFRYLIDVRNNEKKQKKIITNALIVIFYSILFLVVSVIIVSHFITIKYLIYVLIIIILTIFVNIFLQIARGFGNNILYSKASFITGFVNVVLTIIFLVFTKLGISGLFIANIVANLLCVIFLIFKLKITEKFDVSKKDKKIIKQLLHYSIPLIPNSLMWWVINTSDRTIITLILGTSSNGIYAVSNKFSSIFISLYNVFNLSWQESASLYINDKNSEEYFSKTFNQILLSFSSIVLLMLASMPFIFKFLIENSYNDAYNYIPILLISSLFNIIVAFLGGIYIAKKLTKEVAKTSIISAIINLIVNIALIKYIGIYAAAISTLIAFSSMSIYRYLDIQKYIKIKLQINKIIPIIILTTISCLMYYQNNIYVYILNLIMSFVFFGIINKKIIKKTLNNIIKRMVKKNEK